MLCCFESGNFLKLAVWSFNFVIYFRITNKVHFHLTKLMWSLDQPPLMIWINNSSKKKSYNNNKNNDNNLYLHPRNPKKKWKRLEGKWINKFLVQHSVLRFVHLFVEDIIVVHVTVTPWINLTMTPSLSPPFQIFCTFFH